MQPESGGRNPAWETIAREGVRMLTVMVLAMVVAASLFYYLGRPRQSTERDSAGASRDSKEAAAPKADSARPDASPAAPAPAPQPAPEAAAPQPKQASEPVEPPAKANPAASLPSAPAANEAKTDAPAKTLSRDAADPKTEQDPKPASSAPDMSPSQSPSIAPEEMPVDRKQQEKYERVVAEIRAAMAKRDLIGAKLLIRNVVSLVQTPQQAAEIERLDTLIGHLREFWRLVAEAAAKLQPAQEFTVGDTPVIVVEAGPTQLTLRSEGRNQTVQVKSLPRALVDGIVEAEFPDTPANKVLHGAFLAFDPQGDRRLARDLWQQAIRDGQKIEELMAELAEAPSSAQRANGAAPGRGAEKAKKKGR